MPVIFVFVVAAILLAILLTKVYSKSARMKRKLRGASRTTIADFVDHGTSKISGTLSVIGAPFYAPLSGRPCAYFEIHVEQYHSGNNSGSWRTMIRESAGVEFQINDNTGKAIVDPTWAKLALTEDFQSRSGSFDEPNSQEQAFLNRHGKEGKGWFFNKTLRYKESILEAGEGVAILGYGTKEPDPDGVNQQGAYRAGPPMRLRMRGTGDAPLTISDDRSTL